MKNLYTEEQKWEMLGYVKVSEIRYKTLKAISTEYLMPKEISERAGFNTAQISRALASLKEQNLIYCKNENLRKGRIYQITDLGLEILGMIDDLNDE
jgi:predicted transcriptional regulator